MKLYEQLNGKTITFGQLLNLINEITNDGEKGKVYIPIYQRNYKWNRSTGNSNAERLIKELIYNFKHGKSKSLSLFTLYVKDNQIQIVDGQQRMITLMLIFYAIEHKDDFIRLEFERDFQLDNKDKRIMFLSHLMNHHEMGKSAEDIFREQTKALSDKRRLTYNYIGIKEKINDENEGLPHDKYNTFAEFIKNNVNLLLHITSDEPVSEFLNMNSKKIKFRICDMIRAKLIIYMSINTDLITISDTLGLQLDVEYKTKIAEMFEEISNLLYDNEIYKTVKLSYFDPDNTRDNRLNILFASEDYGLTNARSKKEVHYSDFHEDNLVGKEKIIIQRIVFYKKMLDEIKKDIGKSYYLTIRAFIELNHLTDIRFFDLLNEYIFEMVSKDKEGTQSEEELLAKIIHSKFSIDRLILSRMESQNNSNDLEDDIGATDTYKINRYFDALSSNTQREKISDSDFKAFFNNEGGYENKKKFFPMKKNDLIDMVHGSGKYMLYKYIVAHEKELENEKFETISL
ncbi:DUF262 domain-containing protein [Clostridium saccharobutylicum]|nr:DUF262 domain-containing protein [Clostridium saccharobutylicum]MBA2906262.1 uncharacterized protein with ParB-like and HNH nuclease domain [Clostridium saccharobutylicum]MBA8790739.1 uncharacterized protein with ParB-like and HNH nuclease domain [Clostridium saccharobutylicum]MBA8897462.1 uncharacterized protein with ParB-like and HNH nuclease domain [Clostridium saccharobutylicum]MBA8981905.1 uncharacterized protein with ParB-like and HNH nuclease domain [Clostridium saccharobutylicum]MBA